MEFVFEENDQTTQRRPYSSPGHGQTNAQPSNQKTSSTISATSWNSSNKMGFSASSATSPSARRRSVPTTGSEVEMTPNPKRKRKTAKVNYLSEAKAPKKKRSSKSQDKFVWTWNKVGWMICLGVFLRLIFMDRGVAHYYGMQDTLTEKKQELARVIEENRELVSEIHKIKVSPSYQRKLAREHLGVIAQDEYLILFAEDGGPRSI